MKTTWRNKWFERFDNVTLLVCFFFVVETLWNMIQFSHLIVCCSLQIIQQQKHPRDAKYYNKFNVSSHFYERKKRIYLSHSLGRFICNYICFFIHTHMDTLSIYFFSSLLCSIFNTIIIHLNHWHRWSTNFHISIAPQMPSCNKLLIHYKTHHNPDIASTAFLDGYTKTETWLGNFLWMQIYFHFTSWTLFFSFHFPCGFNESERWSKIILILYSWIQLMKSVIVLLASGTFSFFANFN